MEDDYLLKRTHTRFLFVLLSSLFFLNLCHAGHGRSGSEAHSRADRPYNEVNLVQPSRLDKQTEFARPLWQRHPRWASFFSYLLASNSFIYYLFSPYYDTPLSSFSFPVSDTQAPATNNIIDVSNFMNGGIYPTTPSNPVWLTTNNGYVPENAVLYHNKNGVTTYYCRVYYQGDFYQGELIPGKGCDVPNGKTTLRFNMYDVLLKPY